MDIEKIRQEIERRLNILTNVYDELMERKDEEMMTYYHGKVIALEELCPFLDTLSEEPDKGLEEAAETHVKNKYCLTKLLGAEIREAVNDFIAGAEWQAQQGYSLEYVIQYAWGVSDTSTESKKATLSFPLPADIFEGDRVIIQIRKK